MRVLVACEESQIITIAYRKLGVSAFSCDLKPCSGSLPQFHIQADAREVVLNGCWDLIIAHPPSTYLANSGVRHLYLPDGKINSQRYDEMLIAREFFMFFYNLTGVRVCIENPKPYALCDLPKASQTIQPFEFGDPYTKLTLLWLKKLPYLFPTSYSLNKRVSPGCVSYVSTVRGSTLRSKTFPGIANAMANQWRF